MPHSITRFGPLPVILALSAVLVLLLPASAQSPGASPLSVPAEVVASACPQAPSDPAVAASASPVPAATTLVGPASSPVPSQPTSGDLSCPSPGTGGATLTNSTTEEEPLAFTVTILEAPAATEVSVEYLNDSGLPHNIAFYEGPDAAAPRIAATDIEMGPANLQTTTFTAPAEPGSYHFQCDVHPIEMQGVLEVS